MRIRVPVLRQDAVAEAPVWIDARGLQDLRQRQRPEILAIAYANRSLVGQPVSGAESRSEIVVRRRNKVTRQSGLVGGGPRQSALGPGAEDGWWNTRNAIQ